MSLRRPSSYFPKSLRSSPKSTPKAQSSSPPIPVIEEPTLAAKVRKHLLHRSARGSLDSIESQRPSLEELFADKSHQDPEINVVRFGLSEVHVPSPASSAIADIVLVHGLNGNPKDTWTSKKNGIFWPKDLLPQFIEDLNIRVLTYGYDADITSFASRGNGVTKDKIHNHAERLVADLFANRRVSKRTSYHTVLKTLDSKSCSAPYHFYCAFPGWSSCQTGMLAFLFELKLLTLSQGFDILSRD
jgi:hypothetical protein